MFFSLFKLVRHNASGLERHNDNKKKFWIVSKCDSSSLNVGYQLYRQNCIWIHSRPMEKLKNGSQLIQSSQILSRRIQMVNYKIMNPISKAVKRGLQIHANEHIVRIWQVLYYTSRYASHGYTSKRTTTNHEEVKASYICFVSSYTSEVMRCLYMGVKYGLSFFLFLYFWRQKIYRE